MTDTPYEPVDDDAHPVVGVGTPDAEATADHGDAPEERPPLPRDPPAGRPASSLGAYLRRQGFTVDDHPVPGRSTTWDRVRWVVVHHTVSACDPKDEAHEAHYLKTVEGRFPPLAQLMLGQSGKVWVLAEQRRGQNEPGRASHAGEGSFPGIPRDCANQVALGIEVQCKGNHALATHEHQYTVLVQLVAALCRRYGLRAAKVIGHKEWSSEGKVDPRDSMHAVRADVARALASGHAHVPAPHHDGPAAAATHGSFKPQYRQGRRVYASKMHAGQVDSDSVWNVQNALMAKGFSIPDGPTDAFVPEAVDACRRFQEAQGWTGSDADGIPGPVTVKRLGLVWVKD